jgi:hypothetical protein
MRRSLAIGGTLARADEDRLLGVCANLPLPSVALSGTRLAGRRLGEAGAAFSWGLWRRRTRR